MDSKAKPLENGTQVTLHFSDPSVISDSPQSQVLNNTDLLELIFSFLVVKWEQVNTNYRIPTPDSQHLLWASLTCKTFFEPAMNILWQYFDSWTALLQLIQTLTLTSDENIYTTKGVILKSHLERLNLYTRRIKHLQLSAFSQQVSSHVYAGISQFHNQLFPALSNLSIPKFSQLHRDNLNVLFLLSSPTLTVVSLGGIIPKMEVFAASLLFNISAKSRFLRKIHLSGKLSDVTLGLLEKFKRLKTLELDVQSTNLDKDAMGRLWSLEDIQTFSLRLDSQSSVDCQAMSKATSLAPWTLELAGPTGQVTAILQNLNLSQVGVANLSFSGLGSDGSASLARESIHAFTQPEGSSFLQVMEVNVAGGIQIPWKTYIPLNMCQHLTCLEVSVDYLTAERLVRMCGKGEWHALTSLRLTCNRVKPGETGLSLYDLRVFAEHCPSLTLLIISLETLTKTAENIQVLREEVTTSRLWPGRELEELEILSLTSCPNNIASEVAKKSTRDAVVVSRYIHWLFPCLDQLIFPGTGDWFDGVKDMVKGFRSIRTECEGSNK